jgi:hypothetical protein
LKQDFLNKRIEQKIEFLVLFMCATGTESKIDIYVFEKETDLNGGLTSS